MAVASSIQIHWNPSVNTNVSLGLVALAVRQISAVSFLPFPDISMQFITTMFM
jgi:hypothetical protein